MPRMSRWLRTIVPRYRLRTLFALTAVVAVILGRHMKHVTEQREVVAWVIDQGGSVCYAYSYPWITSNGQVLTNYGWEPKFARRFLGDDFFYAVSSVDLYGTPVSDVSPLKSLRHLEELSLRSTQVRDLSPLKSMTSLRIISLNNTEVCNVTPLAGLHNLESLSLMHTQVRDLSPLKSLAHLQWLAIDRTLEQSVTSQELLKHVEVVSQ